jgi:hypothetical protein
MVLRIGADRDRASGDRDHQPERDWLGHPDDHGPELGCRGGRPLAREQRALGLRGRLRLGGRLVEQAPCLARMPEVLVTIREIERRPDRRIDPVAALEALAGLGPPLLLAEGPPFLEQSLGFLDVRR